MSGAPEVRRSEAPSHPSPSAADAVVRGTSLIVCSRNRPGLLKETVDSILAGERLPAELVLVDQSDAPDPDLAAMGRVRGCEVRYSHSASRGVSRARNEAVRLARNPVLVFTDDDVFVARDWFGTLVRVLEEAGPRSVATGRVLPGEGEARGRFVPAMKLSGTPAVYAGRMRIDPLASLSMAMHRSVFDEVGGFDVRLGVGGRFRSAEDNDFGYRLLEAGYRIVYVPEAVVHHRAWRGAADYLPLRWSYGRGQGAFLAKHASLRDRHTLVRFLRHLAGISLKAVPSRLLARRSYPGRDLARGVLVCGDLVYVVGLVAGFVGWAVSRPGEG